MMALAPHAKTRVIVVSMQPKGAAGAKVVSPLLQHGEARPLFVIRSRRDGGNLHRPKKNAHSARSFFLRPYGTRAHFLARYPTLKRGANNRCAYGAGCHVAPAAVAT